MNSKESLICRIKENLQKIRFEVIYIDQGDNPPLEGYPRLFFKNVVTGDEFYKSFIMDERLNTPFSREYGDDVYSYTCIIDGAELDSGMWEIFFEAKDSEGVNTPNLYGNEKFWVIGSAMEIIRGFSLTSTAAGTVPLFSYIVSIPFVAKNNAYTFIGAAISIAITMFSLYQIITTLSSLYNSENTGALLGFGIALLFSGLSVFNAVQSSYTKFFTFWAKLVFILSQVEMVLTLIPVVAMYLDIPWDIASIIYNLVYLPIEFFLMIGSSIIAGVGISLIKGVENSGSVVVKECMRLLALFSLIYSFIAITGFFLKTQSYGVFL